MPNAEGIANRQHQIAHLQVIGVAKRQSCQFFITHINLENGKVAAFIGEQQLRRKLALIGQNHTDVRAPADHVVVGHDQTGRIDDYPGTERILRLLGAAA